MNGQDSTAGSKLLQRILSRKCVYVIITWFSGQQTLFLGNDDWFVV
jgi:hypothetical protein